MAGTEQHDALGMEECGPCAEEDMRVANEMDDEFRMGDCVEVEMDSQPPSDIDDDLDLDPAGERGVINETELHPDDDSFLPEVDDALATASHAQSVLAVTLSPLDRRVLVTGGQDDTAIVWGIEEGATGIRCVERARLTGHTDSVVQVAFSNDGKYLATGGYDGTVRIWAADTGALVHALEGPSKEIEWILWHPKGHAILAGSVDTMAWMWWAPSGKLMQIFAGHAQAVTCGCWGLAGKLVVTGSADQSVIVWNPRAGSPQQHMRQIHEGAVVAISAHPTAPLVVTGSDDGKALVLHIETGKVLATLAGHTDSVEEVRFSESASAGGISLLATGSMDGKIMVWDAKTYELRRTLTEHFEKGGIVHFKWLPAPYVTWLCSCSTDGTLRVFDALAGRCMHTFRGHSDQVMDLDVALGGDGPNKSVIVVSGSDDNTCRVFAAPLEGLGVVPSAAGNAAVAVGEAAAAAAAAAPAAAAATAAAAPGAVPEQSF